MKRICNINTNEKTYPSGTQQEAYAALHEYILAVLSYKHEFSVALAHRRRSLPWANGLAAVWPSSSRPAQVFAPAGGTYSGADGTGADGAGWERGRRLRPAFRPLAAAGGDAWGSFTLACGTPGSPVRCPGRRMPRDGTTATGVSHASSPVG
jgi:hypothetical protein